jgi:hypothetical protein
MGTGRARSEATKESQPGEEPPKVALRDLLAQCTRRKPLGKSKCRARR